MADLLVSNVRPWGGPETDLLIRDGQIVALGDFPEEPSLAHLAGGGRILLPGLIEAHTHLDKSLIGLPWYRNEVGPRLIDKIENERTVRRTLPIDPRQQSERQARLAVSHGVTHIVPMSMWTPRSASPVSKGCWQRGPRWPSRWHRSRCVPAKRPADPPWHAGADGGCAAVGRGDGGRT